MAGLSVPEILAIRLQRGEITQAQHDRALAKHSPTAQATSTRPTIPTHMLPLMTPEPKPEPEREPPPADPLAEYLATRPNRSLIQ